MKIHVSELEGLALDYAVAKTEGLKAIMRHHDDDGYWVNELGYWEESLQDHGCFQVWVHWHPSTDWTQCGPLIESEGMTVGINVNPRMPQCLARAYDGPNHIHGTGDTYLIAACRAIVAAKLGEEVEIPDELAG